jgi:hypothetical protein
MILNIEYKSFLSGWDFWTNQVCHGVRKWLGSKGVNVIGLGKVRGTQGGKQEKVCEEPFH